MIAGLFRLGHLLRFRRGRNRLEPLRAKDTELPLGPRMPAPSLGRVVMIGRTVGSLLVAAIRVHLRIELADPLGIPGERLDCHRAVDQDRERGMRPSSSSRFNQ